MAGFASRGGLLKNAPLKHGSCAANVVQARPTLCQLDKATSGACLETFAQSEAGDAAEKDFCRAEYGESVVLSS